MISSTERFCFVVFLVFKEAIGIFVVSVNCQTDAASFSKALMTLLRKEKSSF